jgi:hypothetical protein
MASILSGEDDREEGCAFILDSIAGEARPAGGLPGACGAPREGRSSYCALHHAHCHAAGGSAAEQRRLREAEILASVVGGRRALRQESPSRGFLTRLEREVRGRSRFFSAECSCNVPK